MTEESGLLGHRDMEFAGTIDCRNTLVIRPQPNPGLGGGTVYVSPFTPSGSNSLVEGTEDTADIQLSGWGA